MLSLDLPQTRGMFSVVPVPLGKISQIPQQRNGLVVLLRLLGRDQLLNLDPDFLPLLPEIVQVAPACFSRLLLAEDAFTLGLLPSVTRSRFSALSGNLQESPNSAPFPGLPCSGITTISK